MPQKHQTAHRRFVLKYVRVTKLKAKARSCYKKLSTHVRAKQYLGILPATNALSILEKPRGGAPSPSPAPFSILEPGPSSQAAPFHTIKSEPNRSDKEEIVTLPTPPSSHDVVKSKTQHPSIPVAQRTNDLVGSDEERKTRGLQKYISFYDPIDADI